MWSMCEKGQYLAVVLDRVNITDDVRANTQETVGKNQENAIVLVAYKLGFQNEFAY